MVCPMRIIVIAVSAAVALLLALIAVLSDEEVIATPETDDTTSLGWQVVNFVNGKFLWRQYIRWRGTTPAANNKKNTSTSTTNLKAM